MFESLGTKFSSLIKSLSGKSKISEKNIDEAIEEIKTALLDADVNIRVVRRFINQTAEEAKGEKVLNSVNPGQQFVKIIYDKMVNVLGGEGAKPLSLKGPDTQSVILMMGLQGSGKTTTASKLALKLKKEGRKPLLVASDLVRPAAVEQLQILGKAIDVPVFAMEGQKDPVKVAQKALIHAKVNSYDVVIVDTAGRMHLDEALMNEIKNINKAIKPDETLFVADSMTGQKAASIAKQFEEAVGISGVILTKFDSDTRGGAAFSIMSVVGKPVKFIGVGEKAEDLDIFYPERIASRILGMGDVVSLVEKAQETYDVDQAKKIQDKINKKTFDLQDYLEQLESVTKMGGLDKMMQMIPGASLSEEQDNETRKELTKEKAIIQSMTYTERTNFRIIGPARRKRIAKGSGTYVSDVNRMLKKFDKLRLQMRKMSKNKKYQAQMLKQMGM
ncbi:MAG: signal recognition particle protein [Sphaerochaetaceae bacterium]|nr:signal recognition particle protein [Sphaerochaetaceae bacterium]